MPNDRDPVRSHIELAIERAREGVSERIDELDRELRSRLDLKQMASEHAPQLLGAGLALGLLVGFGVPRVVARTLQIGVPLYLALQIVKKRRGEAPPDAGLEEFDVESAGDI